MKFKLPDNLKIKLDDVTYAALKNQVKHAYSDVEETETGFIYKVNFEHKPNEI